MSFSTKLAALLLVLPGLGVYPSNPSGGPCGPPNPLAGPRGFFRGNAVAEEKWEQRFRSLPDAAVLRDSNRVLSGEPHHVGSAYDERNARWILAKFREFGLEASIETFYPLFSTPKERLLELVGPVSFRASLAETQVAGDPTSSQTAAQLPSYGTSTGKPRRPPRPSSEPPRTSGKRQARCARREA